MTAPPLDVPGLRSLTLFGSCLSPLTRRADSVPDWFAVVDDLDAALRWAGVGRLARATAWMLPPITVAPKLNLIERGHLAEALATRRDLYLAGRLGKRTELVFARDAHCALELEAALATARATMAEVAQWGFPHDVPLEAMLRRCVSLSYEAELRPERPEKIAALFDAFAPWYAEQYGPLLAARTPKSPRQLDGERRALNALLFRSRLRCIARWPKGMLSYRGWLPYLTAKLRRSRSTGELREVQQQRPRLDGRADEAVVQAEAHRLVADGVREHRANAELLGETQ